MIMFPYLSFNRKSSVFDMERERRKKEKKKLDNEREFNIGVLYVVKHTAKAKIIKLKR